MRGMSAVVCLLFVLVPRLAAQASVGDQAPPGTDDSWPRRLSVHLAAGAAIPSGNDGPGNVQSVSIGYSPTPKLTVLVNGGRAHKLTRVRQFPDDSTSSPAARCSSSAARCASRCDPAGASLHTRWRARALASGIGPKPLSSPLPTPHTWCSQVAASLCRWVRTFECPVTWGFSCSSSETCPTYSCRYAGAWPGVSEDAANDPVNHRIKCG